MKAARPCLICLIISTLHALITDSISLSMTCYDLGGGGGWGGTSTYHYNDLQTSQVYTSLFEFIRFLRNKVTYAPETFPFVGSLQRCEAIAVGTRPASLLAGRSRKASAQADSSVKHFNQTLDCAYVHLHP